MKRERALFDEIIFPNGKSKAFTMSYDDGTIHDRRLVEIMNRYGIRGTFNLNAGFLGQTCWIGGLHGKLDISKIEPDEVPTLYAGHEIAGHGLNHASPTDIGSSAYFYETIEDKAALEHLTGKLVRGYAYPFEAYDEKTKNVMQLAGYHYARTMDTTRQFELPTDFLAWKGTCHHNDPQLMQLAERFCRGEHFSLHTKLFYVWGHSYEFADDDNWSCIEGLCSTLNKQDSDIWFATNIEIFDYVTAFRRLEYGAEGSLVYNPSALSVSLRRGGKTYTIAPLSTSDLDR